MSEANTTPPPPPEKVLLSNPCKFRGKTIEILGVLSNSGGMTTREISNLTGINVDVVGKYCRNGFKRGIIERKEQWGWKSTAFGFFILSINNNNTTESYRNHIGNISETYRKRIGIELSTVPQDPHQLTLSIFNELKLTETERGVVGVVITHYRQTRRPFIKGKSWQDIGTKLNLTEMDDEEIEDLLVNLEVKGIFYLKRIGKYMKVGLLKDFIKCYDVTTILG